MRGVQIIATALCLCIVVAACHRKELELIETSVAYIPISIDWSQSLIEDENPSSISIYIFDSEGGEPSIIISNNPTYNVVKLPIGEYSILIFNEMVSDLAGVSFSDESDFDKINVNITKNESYSPLYHTVADDEHHTSHHDHIAAWHLNSLVVDEQMIEFTTTDSFQEYLQLSNSRSSESYTPIEMPTRSLDSLASSQPSAVTTIMNITVRVENLNNATSIEAIISGTSGGATLTSRIATDTASEQSVIYDLLFTDWSYDDPTNGVDGEINYQFNTFVDESAESEYQLKFNILLQTGELEVFYRNVTGVISEDTDNEIDIFLLLDDEKITLPEYEEPGFNVNGWGDAVQVTL